MVAMKYKINPVLFNEHLDILDRKNKPMSYFKIW